MPSIVSTLRVRYAETDKMGVVYYANYLVWFEVGRADLLRSLGWSYREMEAAGISLPVIEAHCQYLRPARYDDEIEVKTEGRMLSPVRMEFRVPGGQEGRPDDCRGGQDRARGDRPVRQAVPAARSRARGLRMKALVTGVAGFIGSHLSEALLDQGADGGRPRLLHRLLRRDRSRNRTSKAARGARDSASWKRPSRTPICRRCSTA